jgi:hypothetical protein
MLIWNSFLVSHIFQLFSCTQIYAGTKLSRLNYHFSCFSLKENVNSRFSVAGSTVKVLTLWRPMLTYFAYIKPLIISIIPCLEAFLYIVWRKGWVYSALGRINCHLNIFLCRFFFVIRQLFPPVLTPCFVARYSHAHRRVLYKCWHNF